VWRVDKGVVVVESVYFDDVEVGYVEDGDDVPVDAAEMVAYAIENDPWPIHTDEAAASASPFGEVIASFGYVVSLFFRAVHKLQINQRSQAAFLGALEWRVQFRGPVRGGDTLHVRCTVTGARLSSKGDRGVVTTQNELVNQHGETVVIIDVVSLNLTRPSQ